MPIQTALTGDNAGHSSADMGIKRNPRPIVDESALPNVNSVPQPNVVYANSPNIIETLQILDVPDNQIAPATIQTATTPITASNPVNGALATLATLGIITAGAGAITMTATALAKKREQDELKSAQIATLQAQQLAQAQNASANWAENQATQASAHQTIFSQVNQSHANIEYQNAFLDWQKKAFIAMLVALALSLSVGYTPDRICDESVANTDLDPRYEPCGGSGYAGGGGGNRNSSNTTTNTTQNQRPPNPYGSLGGPSHRAVINHRIQTLESQGYIHVAGGSLKEIRLRIPNGGYRQFRRPDIIMRTPNNDLYFENVGRQTQLGQPIARELRAIQDLQLYMKYNNGLIENVHFTPYNMRR